MSDVRDLLEQVISDVDVRVVEPILLPVKEEEHVVGTLTDLERRLFALKVLAHQQVDTSLAEARRMHVDPTTTGDEMDRWVAENRAIRVRLVIISSLLTFSLYARFPVLLDRDIVVFRDHWQIAWAEKFDPRDELSNQAVFLSLSSADYQA